jgi:membrane-associated phospholipid phosphatase
VRARQEFDQHFISALAWVALTVFVAAVVICGAIAAGFGIRFAARESASAVGILGGTAIAAALTRSICPRLAAALGSFSILTLGGAAAGILSMVGQMFAFPLVDGSLAAADDLIGIGSIDVVQFVIRFRGGPNMLAMVYELSIPLLFVSAFVLACLGRYRRVWELCAAFSFCLLVATLISFLFPAVGAFEYSEIPSELTSKLPAGSGVYHLKYLYALRGASDLLIDPMHPKGLVTFPSFHTAMALMTAAAWRCDRYLRGPMIVWNAGVILSAVPIGGHYLIDLVGGAATWIVIFRFGPRWEQAIRSVFLSRFPRLQTA